MIDAVLLIVLGAVPAVVLHEVAHGYSALLLGDKTAQSQGRLSLNPIKHMDIVGSVIVPGALFLMHSLGITRSLILFGWAKPVPVNFMRLRPLRPGIMAVALAGPLTNIVLAFLLVRLFYLPFFAPIAHLLFWAIQLNLTLAVFNMIPIPPLDGSRVVTAMLPPKLAVSYNKFERYGFIIIIILLQLNMLKFIYPIISLLGNVLGIEI